MLAWVAGVNDQYDWPRQMPLRCLALDYALGSYCEGSTNNHISASLYLKCAWSFYSCTSNMRRCAPPVPILTTRRDLDFSRHPPSAKVRTTDTQLPTILLSKRRVNVTITVCHMLHVHKTCLDGLKTVAVPLTLFRLSSNLPFTAASNTSFLLLSIHFTCQSNKHNKTSSCQTSPCQMELL
jgi:hypothetical protein